jgi:thioredoxin reductase (NADPH)
LIVGGSYVAIETAGFLSSLGNDVTLSVRSQMLRGFDEESVEHVVDSLQKVKILQPCQILNIEKIDNGLSVHMKHDSKESTTTFDTVMTAIGRTPSISGLNLEKVGIKVEKDHIVVSDSLQTSISNVYSLGDVVGIMDLTPVAIMQGKFIAEKLFKSSSKKLNYDFIPTTIFSPMEYGVCGITELQSFEKYGKDNVIVYKKSVNVLEFQMGFQHSNHQQAFFKLICLKNQNEKVIGFHYVGPNAGEITGGIAIAMKNNITKEQLDDCVGIHPTLSEIITQLEYGVTKDTGKLI